MAPTDADVTRAPSLNRRLRIGRAQSASLLYAIANLTLSAVRKTLWPRRRPLDVRHVCVYRISTVGDAICALPAIFAIRRAHPDAKITLLTATGTKRTKSAIEELLAGAQWVDEIIVYQPAEIATIRGRAALLERLRGCSFDLWIELPPVLAGMRVNLRNMLFARLSGARWGYGWRVATLRWSAQAQSECLSFPSEVDRLLALVGEMGARKPTPLFPLPLTARHRRSVDDLLASAGIPDRRLVAIAPCANTAPSRWPADRFAEVGNHLKRDGFAVLVVGGPGDAQTCEELARSIGSGACSAAGKISLLDSCELLRRCELLISADSGPQHLAAAVNTPCVSIFSSWQFPGQWYPYGCIHAVLRKPVSCHTCLKHECPYDNRCVKLITAADVVDAAVEVLQRQPAALRDIG